MSKDKAMRALFFPFGVLAVGLVLGGCESAEHRRDTTQTYLARTLDALRGCNKEYPKGVTDKVILRSECQNRALDILRPRYSYPDLLDTFQADRMSIAGRLKKKQITTAQASEELISQRRQMATEEQRRISAGSNGIDKPAIEAMAAVTVGSLVCEKTGS